MVTMSQTGEAPLVSVVVPSLNRRQFLESTLDSILNQDYPYIECIVVDGGSKDGSLEILSKYENRIRVISRPDSGPFDAINDGWRMSSGQVLAWLNVDDEWVTPDAVSTVIRFMNLHPEADVAYGELAGVDLEGQLVWYGRPLEWDLEHAIINCDHVIFQPAAFIRRSILDRVGYLYPAWAHDHDLWLRISLGGGKLLPVRCHLGNGRIWEENQHRSPAFLEAMLQVNKRALLHPNLPEHLRKKSNRIISNSYLRCCLYLPKGALRSRLVFGFKAFMTNPGNFRSVAVRTFAFQLIAQRLQSFFHAHRHHSDNTVSHPQTVNPYSTWAESPVHIEEITLGHELRTYCRTWFDRLTPRVIQPSQINDPSYTGRLCDMCKTTLLQRHAF
jgi:glycosyltransferase involved in cell wall biosynthesis